MRFAAKIQLMRVVVLLLLGAMVNLAVAWVGFSAMGNWSRWRLFDDKIPTCAQARRLWQRHSSDGWPESPDWHVSWHGALASGWSMGLSVGGSYVIRQDATDADLREVYRGSGSFRVEQIDCGLPFWAFRMEQWQGRPMAPYFASSDGDDGLRLGSQVFPACVIPVGFALNTLFYVTTPWVLFFAPFALRRHFRIRRGLCPACAYPVGESAVCTECGKMLPNRDKEVTPMRLTHRVSKLERMHGMKSAVKPCAECGRVAGVRPTRFTVVSSDDPDPGPDFCPACNARLVYTLDFDERR